MSKSEVQEKLKASIEAKLCSLGAYVDKELPEYILVMIANKKNKELMEKDLQLFLGQDTTVFIDWLHDLLGKCQENREKAIATKKIKTPEVVDRSSVEKKKKKDKVKPKKVRKSDEKPKEVTKSSVVKVRRSRSRSISPRRSKGSQLSKTAKPVTKPDLKSTKVSIETKKIDPKPTEKEIIVEKPQPVMSSIVKVTERPHQNVEVLKPSVTMIQRDLKEAESINNTNKRENKHHTKEHEKSPEMRSNVFSRLGKTDLRVTKLTKKSSPSPVEKRPLKRTFDMDEPNEEEDDGTVAWYRHTKLKKPIEEKVVSTNFIVTLNGALNLPLQSRLGPKKIKDEEEDVIKIIDEEMDEEVNTIEPIVVEDMKENVVDEVVVTSAPSRCKFWPNCKNKDSCPFVHPSELCTMFPLCKFGSACLFMHPNCKFEPNCIKLDCQYTHRQPRPTMAIKLPTTGLQQRCHFYPNCTNVNCKYFHPNLPCKFGQVCKAKDTCMFYHPTIPHRTELKWVAGESDKVSMVTANEKMSTKI